MRYGLVLPDLEARELAALATAAESAGWDGVFVWDTLLTTDAWVALAAMALATQRVRLGTMITPLPRRRPWDVASEVATLDRLSGGRMILSVGLGAIGDDAAKSNWLKLGEAADRRIRAERLDESLAIIQGLWGPEPFSFAGQQYTIREARLVRPPLQTPRVPIWTIAVWPRQRSMQRALALDGIIPVKMVGDRVWYDVHPADILALAASIQQRRQATTPFDIVLENDPLGEDLDAARAEQIAYAEAGVTWWLENIYLLPGGIDGMYARIARGLPVRCNDDRA